MKLVADLHIHSRFSRACSKEINVKNLEKSAKIKGVNLLGTGDFTSPHWIKELKTELIEDGSGVLQTKSGFKFLLQTEISLIYSQEGRGKRIHNIVLAPSFEVVDQIIGELSKKGRLDYDGRPIFNIPCPDFVELMKGISKDIEVIPAHVLTPHFSLFGSYNQFSKVEDCFKDQAKHIFALETGLSATPDMLWRVSSLGKYTFVSFSDSHSIHSWRLARESCVFELKKLSYNTIINAMKSREGFLFTTEYFPEEGKYHYTGHRQCKVCLTPKESMKIGNICPKCRRPLTIGVAQRIEELADRPEGFTPKEHIPFKCLVPLAELLAAQIGSGVATKHVSDRYNKLIQVFGSEFAVLLDAQFDELKKLDEKLARVIILNREGKIRIKPGFDGVYGQIILDDGLVKHKQKSLKSFF